MMLIDDLNETINFWINELEKYDLLQLCTKPAPASWSLGQMYMHLINDTTYYIDQIHTCISNNQNALGQASDVAKIMFTNNSFPDQIIKGAPDNAYIPQPESIEYLKARLGQIKNELNKLALVLSTTLCKGKTKHPGLNYFGANEWMQFVDMHFRHHLRQKKRIDDFLKTRYGD